jgi:hypothetical protein
VAVAPVWAGDAAVTVLDGDGGLRQAAPPHPIAATRTVESTLVKTRTSTIDLK